jgi:glycosyltransferase involved in cell wall biosynthesis
MIYISIAAYRDPILQSTIDHAFKTADSPKDIRVGCYITVLKDKDESAYLVTNTHGGKVTFSVEYAGEWFGVCKARNLANQWVTKEDDYVLQIDSHMRFEPGWDSWLISQHKQTNNPKAIIAGYPKPWWPRKTKEDVYTLQEGSYYLNPHENLRFIEQSTYIHPGAKEEFFKSYELKPVHQHQPKKNIGIDRGWYMSGCFFFAPSEYILSVKQPEWILFWGEEVYNSMRAFTHGWNVYIPIRIPIHHLFPGYDTKGPGAAESPSLFMNKPSADFSEIWNIEKPLSTDRCIDAIRDATIGPEHFGEERSISELYEYLGYDLSEMFPQWRDEYWQRHAK